MSKENEERWYVLENKNYVHMLVSNMLRHLGQFGEYGGHKRLSKEVSVVLQKAK